MPYLGFLLNVHVVVDEVDDDGWSPLIHACVLGKQHAVLVLIGKTYTL